MSIADGGTRQDRPGKVVILRAAVTVMGEDGYEGASMRDMAARAGVSVAALYYHFPSKLDLLGEFLDEAYDVILARLDRRLQSAGTSAGARLDEVVGTLIASYVHDDFAQLASTVALREYTRLRAPERAAIDRKRDQILQLTAGIITDGVVAGEFATVDPVEAARAVGALCASLVEPFPHLGRSMHEVIAVYQCFARAIADTPRADTRGCGREVARVAPDE